VRVGDEGEGEFGRGLKMRVGGWMSVEEGGWMDGWMDG